MSARVCAKVSISAAPVPPDIEFRACMKALIAVFWRITSAKLLLVPVKAALTMGTSCLSLSAARALLRLGRSEEHTSELQSLMRSSHAVFCLQKQTLNKRHHHNHE